MFLDPDNLSGVTPAEVLDAAARGHLGLDHRFLHALLDRAREALPAVAEFSKRDRSEDAVDLAPELVALYRHWNASDSIPFLIGIVKEDPENVPDEVIETLAALGALALEPLLALYNNLDESENGEIAFILANLGVRDARLLELLLARLDYDLSDTLILLSIYADPAALPALEKLQAGLKPEETELAKEVAGVIETLKQPTFEEKDEQPFDIWALYPETDDLPMDLLDEDDRLELLNHPIASIRAAAANSFFNHPLTEEERAALLKTAQTDAQGNVRARAWEALIDATDQPEIVEAMLGALRDAGTPADERSGLLVGLAPEADRNEVRQAILELYEEPGTRAKALEAMWRSMHPSFRDYFARHLDDKDLETRRGAVWGVGYYGLKTELDRIRALFANEELRSDALFAYALATPAEVSRGRMKGLLARIERDARGLSEMEEELVKAALDERLMLAGKEPVFRGQED